jgi:hypothetical protein
MSYGKMGERRRDYLLSVPRVWLEDSSPTPDTHSITARDAPINILLAILLGNGTPILIGTDRNATQSVTIVNKVSGKALEVEDSSINEGARIQQVTRNGAPNQRWFIKRTKFIKSHSIPELIRRQAHEYWPAFLWSLQAGYSVIADHSGLCLDILSSADNGAAIQQFPVNGGSSHLWGFVPDNKGFNFIVNLHSGQVLDVADNSLKNYATVQQYAFNGGDSQRWQLLN